MLASRFICDCPALDGGGSERRLKAAIAFLVLLLPLAACEVGPDYQRPPVETPVAYKELDGWKQATPQNAGSDQAWWSIYNDSVLDGLMRQVDISNQNLKASEAAYRQALALTAQARSNLFPTIATSGSAQKVGVGGGTPGQTQLNVAGSLTWELDIWGAIRRSIESASASAQASGADLAAARLSFQSQLATDYFDLRITDELKRLFDAEVADFERSLKITQNRYDAGTAAKTDVAQAETQLEQTRAQAINLGVSRAQFEHAIAVLIGKPPADLTIAPAPFAMSPPPVPVGVPSELLERRPDIAAAERTMAASNAQIGVAISSFYPTIDLGGSAGFTGAALSGLFAANNLVWAVGPQLALTVFDAGNRQAQVEQARAVYDQDVALYRQTVLTAFQQVEDQLAALRILEQEAVVQDRAVKAAIEAEQLVFNQYEAGTVDYTAVITAQTNSLNNQQTALTIIQNRMVANVSLIAALGGGWTVAQMPPGG